MLKPTYQLINQVPIDAKLVSTLQNYLENAPLGKYVWIDQISSLENTETYYLLSTIFNAYELTALYASLLAEFTPMHPEFTELVQEYRQNASPSDTYQKVTQLRVPHDTYRILQDLLKTVSSNFLRTETHTTGYGTTFYLLSDVLSHASLSSLVMNA